MRVSAQSVRQRIADYIEYFEQVKGEKPKELALSRWQVQRLGLYGNSGVIFDIPWRLHP